MPVSELVSFEGVTNHINYRPQKAETQAAQLLQMGIDNFKQRHGNVEAVRGLPVSIATVGFSTESILSALGGSLDPLVNVIKEGKIRGVVGLASCTTLRDYQQGVNQSRSPRS